MGTAVTAALVTLSAAACVLAFSACDVSLDTGPCDQQEKERIGGACCSSAAAYQACLEQQSPQPTASCVTDSDCVEADAVTCIAGSCVTTSPCSCDAQCNHGYACADLLCQARCSAPGGCPTGYECAPDQDLCTARNDCTSNVECSGGLVCSDRRCVTACDGSRPCADGLACFQGGCVLDHALRAGATCSVQPENPPPPPSPVDAGADAASDGAADASSD